MHAREEWTLWVDGPVRAKRSIDPITTAYPEPAMDEDEHGLGRAWEGRGGHIDVEAVLRVGVGCRQA